MRKGKYFYAITRWDEDGYSYIKFFESLDDAIAEFRNEKDDDYYRLVASRCWDSEDVRYREDDIGTALYCVDEDGDEMPLLSIEMLWLNAPSKEEDTK